MEASVSIMLVLQQIRQVFQTMQDSKQLCEVCNSPLSSGEYVCDDAACQMQALEAQAMLGSCISEPPVARHHVVSPALVLLGETGTRWSFHALSMWVYGHLIPGETCRPKLFIATARLPCSSQPQS